MTTGDIVAGVNVAQPYVLEFQNDEPFDFDFSPFDDFDNFMNFAEDGASLQNGNDEIHSLDQRQPVVGSAALESIEDTLASALPSHTVQVTTSAAGAGPKTFTPSKTKEHDVLMMDMMDHNIASSPIQTLGNAVENNPEEGRTTKDSSMTILMHGLPTSTTEANLRSLMAWSNHFIEARLLIREAVMPMPGFSSALFRFSTYSGAQLAKDLLNGKANIDASAYLNVQFTSDASFLQSAPTDAPLPIKRRHKWREEHVTFLERKFISNPKPSTAARQEFATQLGVREKHIQTWFNNSRQRQKNGVDRKQIESTGSEVVSVASLSQERLKDLSKERSSSKSPLERFETSPLGCDNEPSPEVIEAASKQQSSSYPLLNFFRGRPHSLDSGQGYRTPGLDSGDAASTSSAGSKQSSRSNSSVYSFRSKASSEFRRARKVKYHKRSASVTPGNPRKNIGVELDCTSCDTAASFQLTSQATTITCSVCDENLGKFSVVYGLSTSIIKVECPNSGCNHQNYQTTTMEAKDTHLSFSCMCGHYNPRLLLSDIHVDQKYQCTYCHKKYKSKYGWERHETTKHQPREVWICCSGNPLHGNSCIFCSHQNPTTEHFKAHRYNRCAQRGLSLRTYSRKDQFVQHLRAFHKCALIQEGLLVQWRKEMFNMEQSWQCGICGVSLIRWSERLKHIGLHWDQGYCMSDWVVWEVGMPLPGITTLGEREAHVDDSGSACMPPPTPRSRLSVQSLWNIFKRVLPQT